MTDPKRLPITDGQIESLQIDVLETWGYPSRNVTTLTALVDAYRTATATCATCPSYHLQQYMPGFRAVEQEYICRCPDGLRTVSQDGTGYCHNHPDNQRATEGGG
jgi:hypothetical protein